MDLWWLEWGWGGGGGGGEVGEVDDDAREWSSHSTWGRWPCCGGSVAVGVTEKGKRERESVSEKERKREIIYKNHCCIFPQLKIAYITPPYTPKSHKKKIKHHKDKIVKLDNHHAVNQLFLRYPLPS